MAAKTVTMDFFAHQDRARNRTALLVFLFLLAVCCIILAVYGAVLIAFGFSAGESHPYGASSFAYFDLSLFLPVAAVTLLVIGAGSAYRIISLSGGGAAVAQMLGGTPLPATGNDPREQTLRHVVEEMAIAAGMPVPQIYILQSEPGINAFAAGTSTANAVVAVTRGCLDTLTRDELQGVIAHEFSHILNSDMKLNIRLMGVLFGILVLGEIGRGLLRVRGGSSRRSNSDGKGAGAIILFGLLLWLIGLIGIFFGNLIRSAVSRQREFLADAAAVQFTRNPAGIAGALRRIMSAGAGSTLNTARASEAGHFLFGPGVTFGFIGSMFATHPPLPERIKRIEGAGVFASAAAAPAATARRPAARVAGSPAASGFAAAGGEPAATTMAPAAMTAADIVASAGHLDLANITLAHELLVKLPAELQDAAREPFDAYCLTVAMLLGEETAVREQQLAWVEQHLGQAPAHSVRKLLPPLAGAGPGARLPLLAIAVDTLRSLSPDQYAALKGIIDHLVKWDNHVTLFEYALRRIVTSQLDPVLAPAPRPAIRHASLAPLAAECGVLLSAMAHAGQREAGRAAAAFQAGCEQLGTPGKRLALLPPENCGVAQLDAVLDLFAFVAPGARQQLLTALAACSAADGMLTLAEAELLRAVAATLAVPLPPMLAPAAA